ncbi:MAG: alpha-amylase family glycosyl hydrolase [Pseudoramibacter sp.]
MPDVEENNPAYRDYIFKGQDSVVRKWIRDGASGWRLDVADELPDDFIEDLKTALLEEGEDNGSSERFGKTRPIRSPTAYSANILWATSSTR